MKDVLEYALDANIILRYLLKDNPEHFTIARHIFEAIDAGEIIAILDPVNLAEVVWVMQSYYQIAPSAIAPVLETLLYSPHIELVNKDQYLAALRLYGGGAQHFGDACACAAALERCEGRIVSVDRKLNRISGIQRSEQV